VEDLGGSRKGSEEEKFTEEATRRRAPGPYCRAAGRGQQEGGRAPVMAADVGEAAWHQPPLPVDGCATKHL